MKEYSVVMALADFAPVILCAAAVIVLMHDLYAKMSRAGFALFACGTIDIVAAGTLKALYKLLYALGVCDFAALSDLFMPLQSIGFLLAGIAVLMLVCRKGEGAALAAAAPPAVKGTFLFIGLMVAGLAAMLTGLSVIAGKMKKYGALVMFIIAFVCSLCMGYLSSQDFDKAIFNWIAEGVNIVGQGSLLAGALMLHKAKLAEFSL